MSLMLRVLPASNGDSIIIRYGESTKIKNIIIDGGRGIGCFNQLKRFIHNVSEQKQNIELLVITHVDDDHINGILKLFRYKCISKGLVKNIWFNSGVLLSEHFSTESVDGKNDVAITLLDNPEMSIKQGTSLENEISVYCGWHKNLIKSLDLYDIEGAQITILSPTEDTLKTLNDKWEQEINENIQMATHSDYDLSISELLKKDFNEDDSVPNRSSIGFIFKYNSKKVLMLADSHPSIIAESLRRLGYSENNKLEVEIVKLSHHGSKGNTSPELLSLIDCNRFIVSTDGSQHGLPHKECIVKIAKSIGKEAKFYFNYNIVDKILSKSEIKELDFKYEVLEKDGYIVLED